MFNKFIELLLRLLSLAQNLRLLIKKSQIVSKILHKPLTFHRISKFQSSLTLDTFTFIHHSKFKFFFFFFFSHQIQTFPPNSDHNLHNKYFHHVRNKNSCQVLNYDKVWHFERFIWKKSSNKFRAFLCSPPSNFLPSERIAPDEYWWLLKRIA